MASLRFEKFSKNCHQVQWFFYNFDWENPADVTGLRNMAEKSTFLFKKNTRISAELRELDLK